MTSSNPVYKRRRVDVSPLQQQVRHTNPERACMSSWSQGSYMWAMFA